MVNFTQCMIDFLTDPSVPAHFHFNDSTKVRGTHWNYTTFITLEGCRELCGPGRQFYTWAQASNTINTWILPIMGILLQAPFESNKFWQTLFLLARLLGSPMASLAYVLWNIKVSGKAALMIDMAVPYNEAPGPDTDFSSMRDSLYILTVMNQYTMNPAVRHIKREGEGLLRFVLFSKDLIMVDPGRTLKLRRQRLAQELRERRRRGVVPVWISCSWFLFSLAISIQTAFGLLGENRTAHDLALGLLLAWLPVLILCSIVDRNPIAADNIRHKLNRLVEDVRITLQHEWIREQYYDSIANYDQAGDLKKWVEQVAEKAAYLDPFFVGFAGQGRVRWHYGVAHPILADIEFSYIAEHGRDWLRNEIEARTSLVLGIPPERGLTWYDWRELWQVATAVIMVSCSALGASILSYFTPTVGLGCRSGGYMIYIIISFSLLVFEMLVWAATSPGETPIALMRFLHFLTVDRTHERLTAIVRKCRHTMSDSREKYQRRVKALLQKTMQRLRFSDDSTSAAEAKMQSWFEVWDDYDVQQWTERCVFRPLEFVNLCWLFYIVTAQTFGIYRTCNCMTSTWGGGGGYLDFSTFVVNDNGSAKYWGWGTSLSCSLMALGMIYILFEWCLQSHMSTERYESAQSGLKNTRRFRRLTYPYRYTVDLIIRAFTYISYYVFRLFFKTEGSKKRRSLVWTKSKTTSKQTDHPVGDSDPLLQHHSRTATMPEHDIELRWIVTPPRQAATPGTPRHLNNDCPSTPGSLQSRTPARSRSGSVSPGSYFATTGPPMLGHDTAYYGLRRKSSDATPPQINIIFPSEYQISTHEQHAKSGERQAFARREIEVRDHQGHGRPRSTYMRVPSDYSGTGGEPSRAAPSRDSV